MPRNGHLHKAPFKVHLHKTSLDETRFSDPPGTSPYDTCLSLVQVNNEMEHVGGDSFSRILGRGPREPGSKVARRDSRLIDDMSHRMASAQHRLFY